MQSSKVIDRAILSAHPLFWDALSGEFQAQTDPLFRLHTLGRLAYAACTKGSERRYPNDLLDPQYDACEYSPSWAAGFVVNVLKSAPDIRGRKIAFTPEIKCVAIYKMHNDIGISLDLEEHESGLMLAVNITPYNSGDCYPLALGEPVVKARRVVTLLAEELFST